ncbi:hypothetical protein [Nocardioides sp. GY 10127]|uniref:hypothetical protein n=1 Tax=Nocardioides sp. GY 10127 TaxID=2569762 RepID=UPI0010A7FA89|nr:hypothetical protein [Nocardioides sp. GY 10127]TIC86368.1 hypothetical protein E8D37_00170 [Nocardioides sp. GY 10127]
MSRAGAPREWLMFTGIRNSEDAAAELIRLVKRIDEAGDLVQYVLRNLAGCPSDDTEEMLRVARSAINEAIENLQGAAGELRRCPDPDVA